MLKGTLDSTELDVNESRIVTRINQGAIAEVTLFTENVPEDKNKEMRFPFSFKCVNFLAKEMKYLSLSR